MQSNRAPFSRRSVLKYMAGAAAACPTCMSVASALASEKKTSKGAHWTYEGKTGPEHWGDMSAGNKVCSTGVQQSPIDLGRAIPASPGHISVDYKPTTLRVVNNGHTIQCNTDAGSTMTLDGDKFRLLQFHFHHPSEHAMDGRRFDMECHFVHINDAGMLAVLGVFIEPGAENNVLAPVWQHMPHSAGPEKAVSSVQIDPVRLLPSNRQYFRYLGSLTTPPCSEKVIWSVFSQPVQASTAQVSQFAGLFNMNARPLQGLHRRLLLKSS
ncbi:MAG: carbonic anhydrase family protein [Rhodospirillaceae bacterium]|nr:carbonic anhydrase family protein [Rhodospirillaceae bacterium]MBT5082002.1 carbonic anhydrase family protein [Rhodospirillaceae bacterium]MBT5524790.1 carbonic anhydrase family protein [Rhodospirillaceae bacterium]MBT5881169.1 carbonic anhydrase family protein [Rhodospirillaceae bacterium]MBT6587738.1 carbonic anhydrase family protein [Rhodospirillaceae bacterium]